MQFLLVKFTLYIDLELLNVLMQFQIPVIEFQISEM